MTNEKEKDRFEELYYSIYNNIESFEPDNISKLQEMLDIYRALKLQIVQFSDKIEKLEAENSELHIYNDFLNNEHLHFKEVIEEKEKLQKENEERQDTIKQLMEFQEHQKRAIENLQKENQELKEQLDNIIIKIPVKLAKKLNLDK